MLHRICYALLCLTCSQWLYSASLALENRITSRLQVINPSIEQNQPWHQASGGAAEATTPHSYLQPSLRPAGNFPPMGEPQLMSGGVDSWFAKALEAAKAVIAGALLGRAGVPGEALLLCSAGHLPLSAAGAWHVVVAFGVNIAPSQV